MNKSFYSKHILSMVALVLFSICFAACDSGSGFDVIGNPQTNQKLYAACNLATSSNTIELGEELTATVRLDVNQSSEGAEIKQVEFYLDDMFIQKATSSPFVLSYKTDNVSVGTHTLSVAVTVGGKNYEDITITKEATITVNAKEVQEPEEKDPEVGFYAVLPSAGANGNIYHGWVYLDINETSPGCSIKQVDFYWDDRFVTTATSKEAYAFNHFLGDYDGAEGTAHTVKAVATIGGNGYKDKQVTIEQKVSIVLANIHQFGAELLLGKQRIIKNGDNLMCNMWQCYGKDSSPSRHVVSLYWDNVCVSTDSLTVYGNNIVSYPVRGASIGNHIVTMESMTHHFDPVLGRDVVDQRIKSDVTVTVIE